MAALSWKIKAIIANAASRPLVETVDAAVVEVAMVVVPKEGGAEEDANKAVEVEDEIRRLKSMTSILPILIVLLQMMNGLDLAQMEYVHTSPSNVCTSMDADADAEPMYKEEVVVDLNGILVQPMLIKMEHRPEVRNIVQITAKIRMQDAVGTVKDEMVDALVLAPIRVTDSLGRYQFRSQIWKQCSSSCC